MINRRDLLSLGTFSLFSSSFKSIKDAVFKNNNPVFPDQLTDSEMAKVILFSQSRVVMTEYVYRKLDLSNPSRHSASILLSNKSPILNKKYNRYEASSPYPGLMYWITDKTESYFPEIIEFESSSESAKITSYAIKNYETIYFCTFEKKRIVYKSKWINKETKEIERIWEKQK